jgi:hypothetical protein
MRRACFYSGSVASAGENLVSYFRFVYPGNGFEAVFQIAEPSHDGVLTIGELDFNGSPYPRSSRTLIERPPWKNRVAVTGYASSLMVQVQDTRPSGADPFPCDSRFPG